MKQIRTQINTYGKGASRRTIESIGAIFASDRCPKTLVANVGGQYFFITLTKIKKVIAEHKKMHGKRKPKPKRGRPRIKKKLETAAIFRYHNTGNRYQGKR